MRFAKRVTRSLLRKEKRIDRPRGRPGASHGAVVAWRVTEFTFVPDRILVCEADTPQELEALRERAEAKGWSFYAQGDVPDSPRFGVWMRKRDGGAPSVA